MRDGIMTNQGSITTQRVWLVTGASRGLGRALAEEILAHGDLLISTARDTKQLAPLVETYGEQVFPLAVDVRDPAQVDAAVDEAVKHFGRIDILVNNAGYGFIGAFVQTSFPFTPAPALTARPNAGFSPLRSGW